MNITKFVALVLLTAGLICGALSLGAQASYQSSCCAAAIALMAAAALMAIFSPEQQAKPAGVVAASSVPDGVRDSVTTPPTGLSATPKEVGETTPSEDNGAVEAPTEDDAKEAEAKIASLQAEIEELKKIIEAYEAAKAAALEAEAAKAAKLVEAVLRKLNYTLSPDSEPPVPAAS